LHGRSEALRRKYDELGGEGDAGEEEGRVKRLHQ
jgi:hypothetical protein